MEGLIIGLLLLTLLTGIFIGCFYCSWLNKIKEVRLITNWPFIRVLQHNQYNLVHMTHHGRQRRSKRRRNNHQQVVVNQEEQEVVNQEEQVVLPIEM